RVGVVALVAGLGFSLTVPAAAGEATTQRLIVKFKDSGTDKRAVSIGSRIAVLAAERNVPLAHVRAMALDANLVALERPVAMSEARAIARELASHPDVEFAEADGRMKAQLIPN